jgi:hypothetical protein
VGRYGAASGHCRFDYRLGRGADLAAALDGAGEVYGSARGGGDAGAALYGRLEYGPGVGVVPLYGCGPRRYKAGGSKRGL